eukprot:8664961-Pyramimonas_sp.AAC.1
MSRLCPAIFPVLQPLYNSCSTPLVARLAAPGAPCNCRAPAAPRRGPLRDAVGSLCCHSSGKMRLVSGRPAPASTCASRPRPHCS